MNTVNTEPPEREELPGEETDSAAGFLGLLLSADPARVVRSVSRGFVSVEMFEDHRLGG